MKRLRTFLPVAILLLAACHSSSTTTTAGPVDAATDVAPPTWIESAREIWGSGEAPTDLNLSALGDARGPDAGKPTDKILKTAVFTGRFQEQGDALPAAVADRILKTMRLPHPPPALVFRMFKDDIAPDAAMGTIVIIDDPGAPIDWAKVTPKELGRLLPEYSRPTLEKTSFAVTRSFAHAWRAWVASYDFHWDGKPVDAEAAASMCERAASIEMAPGGVIPVADARGKDCTVPKIDATAIQWSCFYLWEDKKEKYDCKVEPGAAPVITIRERTAPAASGSSAHPPAHH